MKHAHILDMVKEVLAPRLNGATVVPTPGDPKCSLLARGRNGGELRIKLLMPPEFLGMFYDFNRGRLILDPSELPDPKRAIFVLNRTTSHAYLITESELGSLDPIDGVYTVDMHFGPRYYDLTKVREKFK